ncbi:MAG: hypothetical protein U0900_04240 [Myxococcota bacterium]
MRRLLTTVIAGILLAVPASADTTPEMQALETLISESAETPSEHAALARYYRSRAELARSNADQQDRMSRSILYVAGNAAHQRFQKAHRTELASQLREQAYAFEARAAAHETAARTADSQPAKGIEVGAAADPSVTAAR